MPQRRRGHSAVRQPSPEAAGAGGCPPAREIEQAPPNLLPQRRVGMERLCQAGEGSRIAGDQLRSECAELQAGGPSLPGHEGHSRRRGAQEGAAAERGRRQVDPRLLFALPGAGPHREVRCPGRKGIEHRPERASEHLRFVSGEGQGEISDHPGAVAARVAGRGAGVARVALLHEDECRGVRGHGARERQVVVGAAEQDFRPAGRLRLERPDPIGHGCERRAGGSVQDPARRLVQAPVQQPTRVVDPDRLRLGGREYALARAS